MRPGCVLMFAALISGGSECQLTSKWAMDYPEYADKYDVPYPDDDVGKWQRMAKQMVDARHVAEESGWYTNLAGGVHDGDAAFLGEIGLLTFPTSWLEARAGLLGGVASPPGILFGGVGGGLRVQTPTRSTPPSNDAGARKVRVTCSQPVMRPSGCREVDPFCRTYRRTVDDPSSQISSRTRQVGRAPRESSVNRP